MLFAMPEVVFDVIAFGFQGVVIYVFNLPASTSGLNNESYVVKDNRMVCDEGILIRVS
jgi:hypothetical protein